jgi:hypothetical protein
MDRGTGYNFFNGNFWDSIPTQRIEPEKTGWPCYFPSGPNGEMVVAHYSGGTQNGNLALSKRNNKGTGDWLTTPFFPPAGASGLLWPRAVSGGTDNDIIHMIAVTTPTGAGGQIYMEQDGALVYSRSTDNGQNWDIQNSVLNEIGSTFYSGFLADVYEFAEPRGNTVAMLIGDPNCDLILMKSTDNGTSWIKTIIWQHPYPYQTYPTDTFYCPDGAHSIAIDTSGAVHVAFGINKRYVNASGIFHWFPLVGGIGYWKEGMNTFSSNKNALSPYGDIGTELISDYNFIGWEQDVNNNGTWDILGEPGLYYLGTSSMPQLVIDEQNRVFMFFSAVTETYNNGSQDYRHIWARGSHDCGQTWGDFIDLNATPAYINSECVFPSCAPGTDQAIHLIFQHDNEPGMAVRGDEHPFAENAIEYMKLYKASLIEDTLTGVITGTVFDMVTGLPVQGACISIPGTNFSYVTPLNGNYLVSGVPSGTMLIECSKPGYFNSSSLVTIPLNDTVVHNFQLQPNNMQSPENLTGYCDDGMIYLEWTLPGANIGKWIRWDEGINTGTGIGLIGGGTFYVGSRWEPGDLMEYDGKLLSEISFFPNADTNAIFNLMVWTGTNAGTLVVNQPVNSFTVNSWNTIPLITPVLIDSSQELWFGYSVTHQGSTYPAGCDDGPPVVEKGDMFSHDGQNWVSMTITYGLSYNWNLAGYVVTNDNMSTPQPMLKDSYPAIAPHQEPIVALSRSSTENKLFSEFQTNDFLGFNIYMNDNLVSFVDFPSYQVGVTSYGYYPFFVTAVYTSGESAPSNNFVVYCLEPCDPPLNVEAFVINQNDIEITWEPPLNDSIVGFNVYANGTLVSFTSDLNLIMEGVPPGNYFLCVSTVCSMQESEANCADTVVIQHPPSPTNFSYLLDGGDLLLQWDSPEKNGFLGCNIYHSHNDGDFGILAYVASNVNFYNYPAIETGLHHFFLTAVHDAGESLTTDTLAVLIMGIHEITSGGVFVFPNPVKNEINFHSGEFINTVLLFNARGVKVASLNVNDYSGKLLVSGFEPGFYLLQIQMTGKSICRKIMLE